MQELQEKVEEKQDENDQLQKQFQAESQAKNKLRQEASRLIAENMVSVNKWLPGFDLTCCDIQRTALRYTTVSSPC